ncbi:cytochrome P450 [Rhizoctonia solani]|nr:cytochrome P450 [Rhizoctonia solani]
MLTEPEIIFTLLALGSSAYLLYQERQSKKPLPPSPAGSYPLVGHALIHPTENEHLTYAKWCKELNSDIISVTVLGQTIVILNSVNAATDLLDRRSTIYSDRPYLRVICDSRLFDWGRNIAILSYGPQWKKQRRIMHEALKPSVNVHNFALFEKETYALLKRLAMSSESFESEFRRTVAAEILSSVYGYTVEDTNDPLVRDNAALVENFTVAAIPGNFIVNFIPWLKYVPQWFPGAGWKRTIAEWRQLKERVMNEPYELAKAQIASGIAAPSIVQTYLASIEGVPNIDLADEEENLRLVGASLFGGQFSWITHASLMSFMLAMVRHPEVQTRAQEEIDHVTSSERLPNMADRDSMPYVRCIIQEVLRWQPPLPLGIPHATVKDDEYRGYFIPKGSVVAMGRDESGYKSPEAFDPERFLNADTPSTSAFGFGRRSCPGSHYAEASLFILFASILAVFDIKPNRILPFECAIKPRSNAHKELIDSA